MKIKIFLIFFMVLSLKADLNPFLEQNASENIVQPEAFDSQEIRFNSNARILKSITFNYIDLDGNEEHLNVDINKSIDWHDAYNFSKSKTPEPSKVIDVSVTIPQKNGFSTQEMNNSLNMELPIQTQNIYDFIAYTRYKNKIKLITTDTLFSDFSMGNPSVIVLDFKSNIAAYPTKNIRVLNSVFKRIDFGSHRGYYRLSIYLDGKYNYKIQKDSNGYLLSLE